jgi:fatty acid desaturase
MADVDANTIDNVLDINRIKQAIPSECFHKDPLLGIHFIGFDFMCWATTVALYYGIETKTNFIKVLYWLSSGFFMWCQFMNGHDCGHGSFSNSQLLNNIMGHTPITIGGKKTRKYKRVNNSKKSKKAKKNNKSKKSRK